MKKVVAGVFALVVSLGAGCVTMTPEEIATEYERQLKMSTRVYLDKKAEDVILAADRVFRLAADDYAISYSPTGLHAQRNWQIYLIISGSCGTDNWNLTTQKLPQGGVKVIATHFSYTTNTPRTTTEGGDTATMLLNLMPGTASMTTRPAIYQLFFARLDYFLGKRTAWVTCKQAEDLFIDGSLAPFCLVANDHTPDAL